MLAEAGGDLGEDLDVVAGARPAARTASRTRCTRRSEFVTVPSVSHHAAGRRQHDVGELRGLGEEQVLHDEVVEAFEQCRTRG